MLKNLVSGHLIKEETQRISKKLNLLKVCRVLRKKENIYTTGFVCCILYKNPCRDQTIIRGNYTVKTMAFSNPIYKYLKSL